MQKLVTLTVLIPFTLVCATVSARAQTHVWKVGGAAPHFTDLQSAVDAAVDGDLLLVRSGTYAAFNVYDKALSILPAQGASVLISGETHIEGSGIGKLTLLGNVSCKSSSAAYTAALVLRNNLGTVLLRDDTIQALTTTMFGANGREGLRLDNSQKVIIDRCQVIGANSTYLYTHGGPGLAANSFNLASFRSNYYGGSGWENPCDGFYWSYPGTDGGHGCDLMTGFAFAAGGVSRGGSPAKALARRHVGGLV